MSKTANADQAAQVPLPAEALESSAVSTVTSATITSSTPSTDDIAVRIARLKALRESKVLTPEEYKWASERVLLSGLALPEKAAERDAKAPQERSTESVALASFQAFLEKTREAKVTPWKEDAEAAATQLKQLSAVLGSEEADTQAKRNFKHMARAGNLTATEVLVLQYLLFASDLEYGRKFLVALLLNVPAEQRVKLHNWSLFERMTASQQAAAGPLLKSLDVPLFPVGELDELNYRMLQMSGSNGALAGGAGHGFFFERQEGLFCGGGLCAPAVMKTGEATDAYVDMSPVEEAVVGLREDSGNTRQRLDEMERILHSLAAAQRQAAPRAPSAPRVQRRASSARAAPQRTAAHGGQRVSFADAPAYRQGAAAGTRYQQRSRGGNGGHLWGSGAEGVAYEDSFMASSSKNGPAPGRLLE